jgi:hypothetical protein
MGLGRVFTTQTKSYKSAGSWQSKCDFPDVYACTQIIFTVFHAKNPLQDIKRDNRVSTDI